MLLTLNNLIQYLRKPDGEAFQISINKKFRILIRLLIISFIVSFTLGTLISILAYAGVFEMDAHAISKLLEEKSKIEIILLAVVAAPLFEELIFRAPLPLFYKSKYFKYIFYGFAIVFGFVHISNYEISTTIIFISPILVAPQITLGLILGYTRIKLGFIYAVLFHMFFNGLLLIPSLLFLEV